MTKSVDKKTFESFLKNYPRYLERDVTGIFEPPLVTYNDFTLGVWPESVVASHYLENDPRLTEESDYNYRIIEMELE
jgi:hypothetical protein